MTTITQVFGGPRRGTFVALIIDSDKSIDLVAKYTGKFKYIYPVQTRFVNAVICSQWQIVRSGDGKGLIPSEDLYIALADASIHPGIDSLVPPVQVVNLNTVLFGYHLGKRKPSRENLYKYYIPRFPEDLGSFSYRYTARDTNCSRLSVQQCDALYMDVNEKRNIKFSHTYAPHVHEWFLVSAKLEIDGARSDRLVYVTTQQTPVTSKQLDAMQRKIRYFITTKIAASMGRGVGTDNSSRFGYKQKPTQVAPGITRFVRVTCTEKRRDGSVCGGSYYKTNQDEHACDKCGIIYQHNDIFVRRVQQSSSNIGLFCESEDEDNLEEPPEDVPYSDPRTRFEDYLTQKRLGLSLELETPIPLPPVPEFTRASDFEIVSQVIAKLRPDIDLDIMGEFREALREEPSYTSTGSEFYYGKVPARSDLSNPETVVDRQNNEELGGVLPPAVQSIYDRAERNALAFKISLKMQPGDEQDYQERLASAYDADREAKRLARNRYLEATKHRRQGHVLYMDNWTERARALTDYRILNAIRNKRKLLQSELVRLFNAREQDTSRIPGKKRIGTFLPLQPEQIRRSVSRLEELGRILAEHNGATTPRATVITLTYIDRPIKRKVPRRVVYQLRDPVNRLSLEPDGLYTHDIHWSLNEGETHPL